MVTEIERSWAMIRAWLERSLPGSLTQAPDTSMEPSTLASPLMPMADIQAWWRCTAELVGGMDRIGLLPPGYAPLSPQDAHAQGALLSRTRNEVLRDVLPSPDAVQIWDREPAGSPQRLAWLPSWLPLGMDVMGGLLFADLRDGPLRGAVRSFSHDGGAGERIHWPSVRSMLADIAAGLSNGTPVDGYLAHADKEGQLRWRPTFQAPLTRAGR
ncbi:hypothetical protein ABT369_47250 [Dactylosporangium sp. NPDC000244]|uniref:hypothetical protein n=1 Tax=Dactylosporangium sp. NPDC000244 TaxID=3154365 RepID=UPI0033259E71